MALLNDSSKEEVAMDKSEDTLKSGGEEKAESSWNSMDQSTDVEMADA